MSDKTDLLAANATFYESFAAGDMDAMAHLWAEDESIACVHPGWPPIVGRQHVLASWRGILTNPGRPRIICRDPMAIIRGDSGQVLCIERIGEAALAASNHFQRVDGVWRMVHHQASEIAVAMDQPDEDRPPPGRVH